MDAMMCIFTQDGTQRRKDGQKRDFHPSQNVPGPPTLLNFKVSARVILVDRNACRDIALRMADILSRKLFTQEAWSVVTVGHHELWSC